MAPVEMSTPLKMCSILASSLSAVHACILFRCDRQTLETGKPIHIKATDAIPMV